MKKLIIMALCFSPALVAAESKAVEQLNYRVSSSIGSSDTGTKVELSGEVRIPVYSIIGLSLTAGVNKLDATKKYIDSSSKFAGIGLFLKKHDLGSIEARYGYDLAKATSPALPTALESKKDTLELNGTYYFERFNVSAARTESKRNDIDSREKVSMLGGAYYITDNMKLSAAVNKYDKVENVDRKNSYNINASYQPEYFDNALSTSLNFNDKDDIKTTTLSVSYYFDTKVSLIDRDRKY